MFADDRRRTLLVKPTYKPYWQLPGVVVEADESPLAATARAVRYELGLTLTPGRLLVTDWVAPSANRIEGLLFVYDGGILSPEQTAEIVLPQVELRSGRGVPTPSWKTASPLTCSDAPRRHCRLGPTTQPSISRTGTKRSAHRPRTWIAYTPLNLTDRQAASYSVRWCRMPR